MNKLTTMALPVPPTGTSLNGSGEAYIASLEIAVRGEGDDETSIVAGTVVEELLLAVNLRRNGFHPRTFAFNAFSVDGPKFGALLERNWSSIDSSGPVVIDLAQRIIALGKRSATVSFTQIN